MQLMQFHCMPHSLLQEWSEILAGIFSMHGMCVLPLHTLLSLAGFGTGIMEETFY